MSLYHIDLQGFWDKKRFNLAFTKFVSQLYPRKWKVASRIIIPHPQPIEILQVHPLIVLLSIINFA
jgi:hypothetical protein